MLYNLHFFPSKCRLFHNATLLGFCITHILNTECAKIWKKFRRQKVNISFWSVFIQGILTERIGKLGALQTTSEGKSIKLFWLN